MENYKFEAIKAAFKNQNFIQSNVKKAIQKKSDKQLHNSILLPSLASITLASCGSSGSSNQLPVAAASSIITMDEDTASNP